MQNYSYHPHGVCCMKMDFSIDEGKLHDVTFYGGCDGNLKAISKLIEGADAREIAELFKGNTCGRKQTSCADQLANAIEEALEA